jgi:prophage maintenance system killer protein
MPRDFEYLTVQDHLWINFQVTKTKNRWNFAKLEQAVYLQYSYGKSKDLITQAARYGAGFGKSSAFSGGNEATGFVGLLCFLAVNGYHWKLTDKDALSFYDSIRNQSEQAGDLIRKYSTYHDEDHAMSLADAAKWVMDTFPNTLKSLSGESLVSL